jgi:hypothetical protein
VLLSGGLTHLWHNIIEELEDDPTCGLAAYGALKKHLRVSTSCGGEGTCPRRSPWESANVPALAGNDPRLRMKKTPAKI